MKELLVALLSSVCADEQHSRSVDSEQCSDRIELGCEDLEDYQGEGELGERCSNVGAFEGPLSGSYFDELIVREVDRASAVKTQPESVFCMSRLRQKSAAARHTPS